MADGAVPAVLETGYPRDDADPRKRVSQSAERNKGAKCLALWAGWRTRE